MLLSFTYLLLDRALAAQDREALESMLQRYSVAFQHSGLAGLRALVDADESEGRHERLLVRVTNEKAEIVYFAQPPGWTGFDLARLDEGRDAKAGWIAIANPIDGSQRRSAPHPGAGRRRADRPQLARARRGARALRARPGGRSVVVIIAIAGGASGRYWRCRRCVPWRRRRTPSRDRAFDTRVATRGTRDPSNGSAPGSTRAGRIERLVSGMREGPRQTSRTPAHG